MSELAKIQSLIEEQGKAFDEFKKANAERLDKIEKNDGYGELEGKVNKILDSYDKYKDSVDQIVQERERNKTLSDKGIVPDERNAEFNKAFNQFLHDGSNAAELSAMMNAMEVKSDPDGGYTVPDNMSQRIVTTSEGNNPMAILANRETISQGDNFKTIMDPDELGYSESAEGDSASDSDTPEIFESTIVLKKIDAEPKASLELIQDSSWDIAAYLEKKAGRIFRKRLNTWLTTGDGVSQARGIMTYTPVANATFEADVPGNWGSVGFIVSGHASTIPNGDCLVDIVGAVDDMYLPRCSWQMKRGTFNSIKKIKVTGSVAGDQQYALWVPSLIPGTPDSLLGYPVHKNDAVAAVGSNALAAVFGDIEESYTIVEKGGVQMLRNPYKSNSWVYFYFWRRVGGGIVNFESLKYLKISA